MLIQVAFFSAYFLFSLPWSRIVNAIGYQRAMVAGLLTMSAGAFLFIPAAVVVSFPLFLTALMVLAAGITGLQVAANPYVVVLGKPETASSRLDLTQAFNSLGTTVAPKLGGLLILAAAPLAMEQVRQLTPQALQAYRVSEAASVKLPFAVIALALVILAIVIGASKLPKIELDGPRARRERSGLDLEAFQSALRSARDLCLCGRGGFDRQFPGELFRLAGHRGNVRQGRCRVRLVLLGRRDDRPVPRRAGVAAGQGRECAAVCAIAAAALVIASMLTGGHAAMWTILAVGFFNSIMFPTIFSLGVAELGPLTGNGSGLLNMAIVGGAVLPVIQGAIADHFGLHHAFVLPVICYLYILFYALSGSRPNSERYGRA